MSFERIEPGTNEWEAYYANHIVRYRFAASRLLERRDGKILDAACGVGYGTSHLAAALGGEILGVDRDESALAVAHREFATDGARFLRDDCETLEAVRAHAPFDAAVSFETLEHLKHPERFLHALREVLSPDGIAILSVPNADVQTSADWEFHERDFDASQLEQILAAEGFRSLEFFGQYLNSLGRLREQIRAEAHRVRFNPFFRLGAWLQERLRGHRLPPALPEQIEDFDILPATPREIREQGKAGPMVIIAVASGFGH